MAYDRNATARAKGFRSYYDYRKVTEFANGSLEFQKWVAGGPGEKVTSWSADDLSFAKLHYQAFTQGNQKDYKMYTTGGAPTVKGVSKKNTDSFDARTGKNGQHPQGAKAVWLITVAGYVDQDDWRRRYPSGKRE